VGGGGTYLRHEFDMGGYPTINLSFLEFFSSENLIRSCVINFGFRARTHFDVSDCQHDKWKMHSSSIFQDFENFSVDLYKCTVLKIYFVLCADNGQTKNSCSCFWYFC
jgi:hypothetical protein